MPPLSTCIRCYRAIGSRKQDLSLSPNAIEPAQPHEVFFPGELAFCLYAFHTLSGTSSCCTSLGGRSQSNHRRCRQPDSFTVDTQLVSAMTVRS